MNVLISSKAAVSPCKMKWKRKKAAERENKHQNNMICRLKSGATKWQQFMFYSCWEMLEFSEIKGWMTHNGVIISPQSILLFVITALHRRRLEHLVGKQTTSFQSKTYLSQFKAILSSAQRPLRRSVPRAHIPHLNTCGGLKRNGLMYIQNVEIQRSV